MTTIRARSLTFSSTRGKTREGIAYRPVPDRLFPSYFGNFSLFCPGQWGRRSGSVNHARNLNFLKLSSLQRPTRVA